MFRGPQSVEKVFFDRLPEVGKAPKASKPRSSAYRWYGRERFALQVKMPYFRSIGIFELFRQENAS